MAGIFTPVNQIRLTNVAVVRVKRKGKRFELACYKNKVVSWREGSEKDLDEVVQSRSVFANVSKGILARKDDILSVFKTNDEETVIRKILEQGEVQLGERERHAQYESLAKDIATLVAEQCIDTSTRMPVTAGAIERAMREQIHYSISTSRGAKQQALEVIRLLRSALPIERTRMRVELSGPMIKDSRALKESVGRLEGIEVESQDFGQSAFSMVCRIDPGHYRILDAEVSRLTKGRGRMDVLDMRVVPTAPAEAPAGAPSPSPADTAPRQNDA